MTLAPTLRAATAADNPALSDLILTHGPNPWNWLPPDDVARHLAEIATGANGTGGVLAFDQEALIGAVTFCTTRHFARYQDAADADALHGYICEAVVHRAQAGRGLGARLLAAAIGVLAAQGLRDVYIDRHEENAASAGMMRKAGFVEIDTFAEPARRPHGSGRTTVCRLRTGDVPAA
ncbi:MAG: GNAT family N-acetyltransferase [Pseudomonadota bacterium]